MTDKLIGLVLVGGKSKRMGSDKSQIKYHTKPQYEWVYHMLLPFCSEVYLSKRKDQSFEVQLPTIEDRYADAGPLAGILSAFEEKKDCSFLVLACDLPFLKPEAIRYLIDQRDSSKSATCYIGYKELPEPLCAIFENKIYNNLVLSYQRDIYCPRKILMAVDTHAIFNPYTPQLENINTQDEMKQIGGVI